MEMLVKKGFFNPRRLGLLLLRDFVGGYRSMLIAMAAVAGTVIVLSFLTLLGGGQAMAGGSGDASAFHLQFYIQLLFFGGFILTSLAFREARQNGAGIFYMTLPASAFEKLVSKLLVTSVGFGLGSLIFYTATAAASEGINRLIFGFNHDLFNPFNPDVLKCVGIYLICQSVYLLGSIWFKKTAFLKTVLGIALIAIGVAVVAAVLARILMADHFVWNTVTAGSTHPGGWSMNLSNEYLKRVFAPGTRGYDGLMVFKTIADVLFYGILAPVCWLASYFRLRETEV